MSSHFRNIDWNFNPLKDMDLSRFTNPVKNVPIDDINDLVLQKFVDSNLKLVITQAFFLGPGHVYAPHLDGKYVDSDLWISRCKINWVDKPVALNKWFDVAYEDRHKAKFSRTSANTHYVNFSDVPKEIAEEAYIEGWHIFEAGKPHQVMNNSNESRWCISFIICEIENHENGWITMKSLEDRLKI
jgi:hypothetical protein